jgi:cell division control protein 6
MNTQAKEENLFDNLPEDRIFKDKLYLKYEYTPDYTELVGREEQMEKLGNKLSPILQGKSGSIAFVTGLTGNGKTTTVRISLEQLEEQMERRDQNRKLVTSYIEECSSQLQVFRRISEDLDLGFQGTEIDRHISKLKEKIKENDMAYIVALDDIDTLFEKGESKDDGNKLLKSLYEARVDILNNSDGDLVVIGVTNNVNFTNQFNSKNRSRYTQDTIRFPSYNATQLRNILEVRAEKAFRGGVPDNRGTGDQALQQGVISKISAKIAKGEGDARKAIKVLRKVGEMAVERDCSQVKTRFVDQAIDEVEKRNAISEFKNLPKDQQIAYYAILQDNRDTLKTKRAYKRYKIWCDRLDVSPVSKKRLTDFLSDLENSGFIEINSKKLGHGGRTNTYKSLHNEELQEEIMKCFSEKHEIE